MLVHEIIGRKLIEIMYLPNNTPGEAEIMTKSDVAKFLKKSQRTIDAWMASKLIPYIKVGHSVIFRRSVLLAHLDKLSVQ